MRTTLFIKALQNDTVLIIRICIRAIARTFGFLCIVKSRKVMEDMDKQRQEAIPHTLVSRR